MKNLFTIAVLTAALFAHAETTCSVKKADLIATVPEYTISNGVIEVKCIPEASGVISGFYSIPEKRQMIKPLAVKLTIDDLLPRRIQVAPGGLREIARLVKVENFNDYKVTGTFCADGTAGVNLYSRAYYSKNLSVKKSISLRSGEARAVVDLNFTAQSSGVSLTFWINGIANLGTARDNVLMPVDGTVKIRAKKGLSEIGDRKGILFNDRFPPQDCYAAPIDAWMASVSPERPGVLALVVRDNGDMAARGTLCAWKHASRALHTTEMIFPERTFNKGDSWNLSYEYLYFAPLKSLRDVAGCYGIDRDGDSLIFASAIPVPAGSVELSRLDASGKRVPIGKFHLPALKPGDSARVDLRNKNLPADLILTGTLPTGETFTIHPLLLFP